jgi:hypothetical protein
LVDSTKRAERNRLVILRRDLERRINPLVAKETTAPPLSDDERVELQTLRLDKAAIERRLKSWNEPRRFTRQ